MNIRVFACFVFAAGFLFQCETFASGCLFGSDINQILNNQNPRLLTRNLGPQIKLDRTHFFKKKPRPALKPFTTLIKEQPEVIRVEVIEIKPVNAESTYHLNYTKEDQFDGGNSFGWIEDLNTLELVAIVQDSEILDCTVTNDGQRLW